MALTSYMISQASDHLSDKQKELWIFWFRQLQKYKDYAIVYNEHIVTRLDAAEGTIKARMLNALMKEIDDLGVGEVHIGFDQRTIGVASDGNRDGTHWSQTIERQTLIQEGLDVLFDDISTMVVPPSSVTGSHTSFKAATGQRTITVCCPFCQIHYHGTHSCRTI